MSNNMQNKMQVARVAALPLMLALGMPAAVVGCSSMDGVTQDSHAPAKDTWITTKVMSELATVNGLDNTRIGVETSNGIVTLTGSVDNQSMMDTVMAAVKRIDGVVEVNSSMLKVGG